MTKKVWVVAVHKEGNLCPVAVAKTRDDMLKTGGALADVGRVIAWQAEEISPHKTGGETD